jgi:hypothetical protein
VEDFGYQKTSDKQALPGSAKGVLLALATLFSLAIFVYITVSAYYFVHQDKDADIETIKSPEGPIKVTQEEKNEGIQVDHAIYEDIFGNKQAAAKRKNVKIRAHPEPALPPVKEPAPKEKEAQKIVVYSAEKKEKEVERRDNTAPAPKPKSGGKKIVRVQIAAMSSRDAASEHWQKFSGRYSSIFSDLKPFIEKVDLGKRGIFFRLQVGNFPSQIEAEKFCSQYVIQTRKNSADCIVVE